MKINEEKLKEYIEDEEIEVFDTEKDFLEFVNIERKMFYFKEYPNDFKSAAETAEYGGEYVLIYKDKYYWILFEHCLDIYE